MEIDLENLNGALFKNKYKEAGSNQPDYKGSFQDKNTREKILDVAAWERTSKDGNTTYFSLKISQPFQGAQNRGMNEGGFAQQSSHQPANVGPSIGPEDDIPF